MAVESFVSNIANDTISEKLSKGREKLQKTIEYNKMMLKSAKYSTFLNCTVICSSNKNENRSTDEGDGLSIFVFLYCDLFYEYLEH